MLIDFLAFFNIILAIHDTNLCSEYQLLTEAWIMKLNLIDYHFSIKSIDNRKRTFLQFSSVLKKKKFPRIKT